MRLLEILPCRGRGTRLRGRLDAPRRLIRVGGRLVEVPPVRGEADLHAERTLRGVRRRPAIIRTLADRGPTVHSAATPPLRVAETVVGDRRTREGRFNGSFSS